MAEIETFDAHLAEKLKSPSFREKYEKDRKIIAAEYERLKEEPEKKQKKKSNISKVAVL